MKRRPRSAVDFLAAEQGCEVLRTAAKMRRAGLPAEANPAFKLGVAIAAASR